MLKKLKGNSPKMYKFWTKGLSFLFSIFLFLCSVCEAPDQPQDYNKSLSSAVVFSQKCPFHGNAGIGTQSVSSLKMLLKVQKKYFVMLTQISFLPLN